MKGRPGAAAGQAQAPAGHRLRLPDRAGRSTPHPIGGPVATGGGARPATRPACVPSPARRTQAASPARDKCGSASDGEGIPRSPSRTGRSRSAAGARRMPKDAVHRACSDPAALRGIPAGTNRACRQGPNRRASGSSAGAEPGAPRRRLPNAGSAGAHLARIRQRRRAVPDPRRPGLRLPRPLPPARGAGPAWIAFP